MNAKPSRNTKATIAAAAREEFARLGYAGARVERITRRAGVNKQLIFYYFGSKRGLYDSVVQGAAHGVLQGEQGKRDDPGAATDGLRRAVQQLFDDLQAQPDVTMVQYGTKRHKRVCEHGPYVLYSVDITRVMVHYGTAWDEMDDHTTLLEREVAFMWGGSHDARVLDTATSTGCCGDAGESPR